MNVFEIAHLKDMEHAYFTMVRARAPQGDKLRLFGRFGPVGQIVNTREDEKGGGYVVVVRVAAEDLKRWIDELDQASYEIH